MPGSPSSVGRGAGIGGMPSPATPWLKDLGSSNLPPGVRLFRPRDRWISSGNYLGRFAERSLTMLMRWQERRVDRASPMKQLRFLWWTYTVRGTDFAYVEVESRFGLTRAYSLGRWVLANLFGLSVVTAFVLVTFIQWIGTGSLFFLVVGTLFAILLAVGVAFFVWSMTPSR
jgi:hypothetical protein